MPRAGQDDLFHIDVDFDAREEGAAEMASRLFGGLGVDPRALLHHLGGEAVGVFDLLAGDVNGGAVAFGGYLFTGDAGLFAAQQVEGYGVGVGHLEQFAPLGVELREPGFDSLAGVGLVSCSGGDVGVEAGSDGLGVEDV